MSEHYPGGAGQFARETDAAIATANAAYREQQHSEAIGINQGMDKEASAS
jgi:hypothetical protein